MSDQHDSDPNDLELFRQTLVDVRPLEHDRIEPEPRHPPPYPRKTRADEAQVLQDMLSLDHDPAEIETGEELVFARPGLQHRVMRKLRRGQFSVRAELDLHGMNAAMARDALVVFLRRCRDKDQRCVRIVHGKGRGSSNRGPVLKGLIHRWLQQRDEVLAFCSALPRHGGTGAVYVLLKHR